MKEPGLVLLVEDNKNDIVLITRAFARAGIMTPIRAVGTGEEAMAYLRNEGPYAERAKNPTPSLILLDLGLPGIDGFELLKWIRSQRELRAIRVVVLTGRVHLHDVRRAYELGANSFLTKPLEILKIDALIRAVDCPGFWIEGPVYEFGCGCGNEMRRGGL